MKPSKRAMQAMGRPFRSRLSQVAMLTAVTVGILTWLALAPDTAPTSNASDPWYWWLLAPSIVEMISSGGVHGGAPMWVMMVAMIVANSLCWALAVYVLARLTSSMRKIWSRRDSSVAR